MTEQQESSEHLTAEQVLSLAEQRSAQEVGPVDPASVSIQHLEQCPSCRDEVEATARVVRSLRPVTSDEGLSGERPELAEPPPELWAAIAGETGQTLTEPQQPVTVIELSSRRDRRSRTWVWAGAAAAAGLVVGAALVTALLGMPQDPDEPEPQAGQLAGQAQLEPVRQPDFTGQAHMMRHEDGQLTLTVQVPDIPAPEDGYLELWLRDEQATRLISLGTVTATTTTVTIPQGVDLSAYPVVDVSHEHFDGDPSHSGVTLAAGPMETTDS